MSSFLLRIEAIEAKALSCPSPRGTCGRLLSLRLKRRRFHNSARPRNVGAAQPEASHNEEDIPPEEQRNNEAHHDKRIQDVIGKSRTPGLAVDLKNQECTDRKRRQHHAPPSARFQYMNKTSDYYRGDVVRAIKATRGNKPHLQPEQNDRVYTVSSPSGDFTTSLPPPTLQELYETLHTGNPHAIVQFATRFYPWYRLGREEEFRQLPASTFSQLLHALDPDALFGRYQKLYTEMAPHDTLTEDFFQPYHLRRGFRDLFMRSVNGLLKFRLIGGHHLSLSDYQHSLRCARAVGDLKSSEAIWRSMSADGVLPGTTCYNHYMAVMVESDSLEIDQRHKVRVTPSNLEVRQWGTLPKGYEGYRVGENGLKQRVSVVFDMMTASGVVADEETMCLVMLAFAKEGDLDGAKNILDKVWGVHVEKLLAFGENGMGSDFSADSPTQPSSLLLHTLAHAFGINNSIPVALRLVDFVSRRYSLGIPLDVWEELLERTFVLSTPRSEERNDGFSDGILPVSAVSNLWTTFTSEPYNVVPTMSMYDKLIRNLFHQQRWGQAQGRMDEARVFHNSIVAKYTRLLIERASLPAETPSRVSQTLDDDLTFLGATVYRNSQYIRQWCTQLIEGQGRSVQSTVYSELSIPRIVYRWNLYLPRYVAYKTPTGFVSFRSGSKALIAERVAYYEAPDVRDELEITFDDSGT